MADDGEGRGSRTTAVVAFLRQAAAKAAPEQRLPSIRQAAERQGVSPSTVVEAYERLAAEGVVAARPGSGFYAAARTQPLVLVPSGAKLDRAIDPLWIMRQSLDMPPGALRPGCGWLPDAWLPEGLIRQALRSLAREGGGNLTAYAPPAGHMALRLLLARRLAAYGIEAGPQDILLVDSGSAAIDLVCRFLLRPGDVVMIDDPGYFNLQATLRAQGLSVIGVPATPAGPDLAAFAALAAAHRPKLYVTVAALHNPTGASLSPAAAHRLLKLAEAHGMVVIEDDIFGDFETVPSPRLAALDGFERVIHLGSFSKTLSAAARCGYIAARRDWIEGLVDLKLATAFGHQDLSAQLVGRLLAEGGYRRHVESLRARLAKARGRVVTALRQLGLQPWLVPQAGLFIWAELPEGLDSAVLARKALERNIVLAPGNVFSVGRSAGRFLRFNIAQCEDPALFRILGEIMR